MVGPNRKRNGAKEMVIWVLRVRIHLGTVGHIHVLWVLQVGTAGYYRLLYSVYNVRAVSATLNTEMNSNRD